jgi:hypothetical protein
MTGDDNFFALLDQVEQLAQFILGLEGTNQAHTASPV